MPFDLNAHRAKYAAGTKHKFLLAAEFEIDDICGDSPACTVVVGPNEEDICILQIEGCDRMLTAPPPNGYYTLLPGQVWCCTDMIG